MARKTLRKDNKNKVIKKPDNKFGVLSTSNVNAQSQKMFNTLP